MYNIQFNKKSVFPIFHISYFIFLCLIFLPAIASAASLNPFREDFKLSVCDGPDLSNLPTGATTSLNGQTVSIVHGQNPANYTPCNFTGMMLQAQHLIDAMIVLGVLAAIIMFTYAGAMLIWSGPDKRNEAKDIFRKVGIGFIIMLTAWFIVYQLLSWATVDPGVKALLGTP